MVTEHRRVLRSVPSSDVDHEQRGYPRPQLRRDAWYSLNGAWDFALDPEAKWSHPSEVSWRARIRVPFAPEAPASGVEYTGFIRACWYRCALTLPRRGAAER